MHAVGVIPARFQSSRFPGKPLTLIAGKTLIERVYERAREARRLDRLLVATDDQRILNAVEAFGGEAVLTSARHPSGTDRLAEVARRLPSDLYANIQGDEPMLDPRDVDGLIEAIDGDPEADMATLCEMIDDQNAVADPNVVKVVCDDAGRALYFSRSPIPHVRGGVDRGAAVRPGPWLRHVGIYVYRPRFLADFASRSPGALETLEGLEQLRALEMGGTIRVLPARGRYHGVDTPGDVVAVERALGSPSGR